MGSVGERSGDAHGSSGSDNEDRCPPGVCLRLAGLGWVGVQAAVTKGWVSLGVACRLAGVWIAGLQAGSDNEYGFCRA